MAARAKAPNKQHVPVNFVLSAWALRSVARFVKATATASRGAVYLNTSPLFFFFRSRGRRRSHSSAALD